jgi:hypothetical protein
LVKASLGGFKFPKSINIICSLIVINLIYCSRRFDKIVSDCITLSYKEAGVSCEAYDIIAGM